MIVDEINCALQETSDSTEQQRGEQYRRLSDSGDYARLRVMDDPISRSPDAVCGKMSGLP
jgi:hypothetical protein